MGRRSRARERAARPVTAQPAAQAEAGRPRRALLGTLNPFSFQRPTRSRVRFAALAFAVLAVVLGVLGWVTGTGGWFNSAVLLAILALLWGARAAFMREDDRSS
jgi:fatty acid desaturase